MNYQLRIKVISCKVFDRNLLKHKCWQIALSVVVEDYTAASHIMAGAGA